MNGQVPYVVVITHTCARMNRAQGATHLEPQATGIIIYLFAFFVLFFLILIPFFTDNLNHLNHHNLDHHFCHFSMPNGHQTGHHLDM